MRFYMDPFSIRIESLGNTYFHISKEGDEITSYSNQDQQINHF
jgi:hypothetical protein